MEVYQYGGLTLNFDLDLWKVNSDIWSRCSVSNFMKTGLLLFEKALPPLLNKLTNWLTNRQTQLITISPGGGNYHEIQYLLCSVLSWIYSTLLCAAAAVYSSCRAVKVMAIKVHHWDTDCLLHLPLTVAVRFVSIANVAVHNVTVLSLFILRIFFVLKSMLFLN